MLIVSLLAACALDGKQQRRTNLPHGNNVEYKHGAKILTQRFEDRDELDYSLSDFKLKSDLSVNSKIEKGHSFAIGSTASCKLSNPPPDKLEIDFVHEVPNRKLWHYPEPLPLTDLAVANATFDISIEADDYIVQLPRRGQIELRKDEPSDDTFWESYITEILLADLVRVSKAKSVKIRLNSIATFDLNAEAMEVLKAYSVVVSDTERW